MRRTRLPLLLSAFLLSACLLFSALLAGPADATSRDEVRRMIVQEALRSSVVPPSLALAVAKAESDFVASAVSSAGARGVMQIMPATGRGEFGVTPEELWSPRLNIQLGIAFLASLIGRYDGRWDLALSHYNGGSAVGRGDRPQVIPATRAYVDKVLRLERGYARDVTVEALIAESRALVPVLETDLRDPLEEGASVAEDRLARIADRAARLAEIEAGRASRRDVAQRPRHPDWRPVGEGAVHRYLDLARETEREAAAVRPRPEFRSSRADGTGGATLLRALERRKVRFRALIQGE